MVKKRTMRSACRGNYHRDRCSGNSHPSHHQARSKQLVEKNFRACRRRSRLECVRTIFFRAIGRRIGEDFATSLLSTAPASKTALIHQQCVTGIFVEFLRKMLSRFQIRGFEHVATSFGKLSSLESCYRSSIRCKV